jgi:acetyltransferase-like isoleucine patch superfamily enzyme
MSNDTTKFGMAGKSPISFGRFTYGGENITVFQFGEGSSLKIGAFCSIASSIKIFLGGNHRIDWITTFPFGHIFQNELGGLGISGHPSTNGDVVVGNDVWIGQGATIMSGITIGSGAVIATNSTVTRDVGPYEIVGGNPAKVIKKRFDEDVIDLLLKLNWWDLPVEKIREVNKTLCSKPSLDLLHELIRKTKNKVQQT